MLTTKQAILKAVRFTKSHVHFLDTMGATWVRGMTPEGCGIMLRLGLAGPSNLNVMVDAKKLNVLIKAEKEITSLQHNINQLVINSQAALAVETDTPGHPLFPETMTPVPHYEYMLKVLYAAGKDQMEVVRSTGERIEAFDEAQAATVDAFAGWVGYVPANVFRYWDTGDVSVSQTPTHVLWRIGADQYRYAPMVEPKKVPSPDKLTHILESPPTFTTAVPRDELIEIVKTATDLSTRNLVVLQLKPDVLRVSAWMLEGEASFQSSVPSRAHHGNDGGSIILEGKRFQKALKSVGTPSVRLDFRGELEALRMSSGGFQACLFPCLGGA